MTRSSNSGDWYNKAKIEYFSIFIKLWLSFNSYYKHKYEDDPSVKTDREHIEKIKELNRYKNKFRNLFEEESDEGKEFRMYLSELMKKYAGGSFGGKTILKTGSIKPQMNGIVLNELSFEKFIHPDSYHITRYRKGYQKLGDLHITDNFDDIWPYYVEIIYMIRNSLVHGEMEPTDENHEIIKNCYHTLDILIKDGV